MFSILVNCYSSYRKRLHSNKKLTLIILGLDNAGKTTTVRDLKRQPITDVTPSLGFANVTLKLGNTRVTLFDVGGGATIRDIWTEYYCDVHGVIYVIDSSDPGRLQAEAKTCLEDALLEPRIRGKPVLLLANKQDKENSLNESGISKVLELQTLIERSESICRVECCSAVFNNGKAVDPAIKRGFRWLVRTVLDNWSLLEERIALDKEEYARVVAQRRAAKQQRVLQHKQEKSEQQEKAADEARDGREEKEFHVRSPSRQAVETMGNILKEIGGEFEREPSSRAQSRCGTPRTPSLVTPRITPLASSGHPTLSESQGIAPGSSRGRRLPPLDLTQGDVGDNEACAVRSAMGGGGPGQSSHVVVSSPRYSTASRDMEATESQLFER